MSLTPSQARRIRRLRKSEIDSDQARRMAGARKNRAGGRPRSDQPRCACGAMTLRRAKTRRHKCAG